MTRRNGRRRGQPSTPSPLSRLIQAPLAWWRRRRSRIGLLARIAAAEHAEVVALRKELVSLRESMALVRAVAESASDLGTHALRAIDNHQEVLRHVLQIVGTCDVEIPPGNDWRLPSGHSVTFTRGPDT